MRIRMIVHGSALNHVRFRTVTSAAVTRQKRFDRSRNGPLEFQLEPVEDLALNAFLVAADR
jgi:hypothetical protein